MTDDQRDARNVKKHLKDLCATVSRCLELLAVEMKKPGTTERRKQLAVIADNLEFANDTARHFGLGEKLRKSA